MDNRSFSVYMHINKINNKRYVGITSRKISNRWKSDGKGYKTQYFYKAIQKYGWDSFEHIIIAEGLSQNEALKMESSLIEQYKTTIDKQGYNVRKHGGMIPYKEGKSVLQFDILGNYIKCFDRMYDAEKETGIAVSNIIACCNKKISCIKGFIWRYKDDVLDLDEVKKELNPMLQDRFYPVYQFSLDRIFIKEYSFASEASKQNPKWYSSSILDNCRGLIKNACGYLWKFKKDVPDICKFQNEIITEDPQIKPGHEVLQFDLEGNFIAEFQNAYFAAEEMNCDSHTITYACSGRTRSGKGYLWRYKRDYKGEKIHYVPYTPNTKKVVQCDLDGNVIAYFASAQVASNITGICRRDICANCNLNQKTAHGFIWKYLPNNELPKGAEMIG